MTTKTIRNDEVRCDVCTGDVAPGEKFLHLDWGQVDTAPEAVTSEEDGPRSRHRIRLNPRPHHSFAGDVCMVCAETWSLIRVVKKLRIVRPKRVKRTRRGKK